MKTLICSTLLIASAVSASDLKPVMTIPGEIVVSETFDEPGKLDKSVWLQRQGTRWAMEKLVLRGRESSPEYQAKRSHHRGLEPRLSIPVTPNEFVTEFSVRFMGDKIDAIVPFVEFGHHVCRVRFDNEGVELLAEGESLILAQSNEVTYEPGRWFHCLAEMKDGHFVMQIEDGPTLYANRDSFKQPPLSGGNGFGVAGPKHGVVELDDIVIRKVHSRYARGWDDTRNKLDVMEPIVIAKNRQRYLDKHAEKK